jgi:multidrug efflux system membrane fusion protein
MPDVWEAAHALNPSVADNNGDFDNNGYTNLEQYLNDIAAIPAPAPLVFSNAGGTSRYAQIGNWTTGVFQPSRYDEAQINSAKLNITYCHITAPFTGRVGLRQVDAGNIVHASDANPMLILTQLQPIAVIFTLPEDVLPRVAGQMRHGTLEVDAFSRDDQTKLASGKLLTIDNQIDPTTGTAKLKAVFSNQDNKLWPNQFVNTDLLVEMRKNSTVVPTAAILRGPQGTYVYSVNPDKTVEDKSVTVALTQGDTTVVSSGVNPGDTVVTDGQDKLQRGSRIEPRAGAPSHGTGNAPVTGAVSRPGQEMHWRGASSSKGAATGNPGS